ncbi:hypothetical protein BSKO_14028 [Bryopsis sp. KO-2023]|nr:hypothetical protein BSKO_14028 [Bryopsis sp. KO-2023]
MKETTNALCQFVQQRLEHVLFGSSSESSRDQIRDLISAGEALGMIFPRDLVRLLAVRALQWKLKDGDELNFDWLSLVGEACPLTDSKYWLLNIDARTQGLITMLSARITPRSLQSKHFDDYCKTLFSPGFSKFEPESDPWKQLLVSRGELLQSCRAEASETFDLLSSIKSKFPKEKHLREVEAAIESIKGGLSMDLCLAKHLPTLQQAGFSMEMVSGLEIQSKTPAKEKAIEKVLSVADAERSKQDRSFSFPITLTEKDIASDKQAEQIAEQGCPLDLSTWSNVGTPRNPPKKPSENCGREAAEDDGDPYQTPVVNRRANHQYNPITPVAQRSPGVLTVLTPGPGKAKQQTNGQLHGHADRRSRSFDNQQTRSGSGSDGGHPGRSELEIGNRLREEEPWKLLGACSGQGCDSAEESSKKSAETRQKKPSTEGGGRARHSKLGLLGADQQLTGGWRKKNSLETVAEEPSPGKEKEVSDPAQLNCNSKGVRRDVDALTRDHGKGPMYPNSLERNDGRQKHAVSRTTPDRNPKSTNRLEGKTEGSRETSPEPMVSDNTIGSPPKMMPAKEVIKKYVRMALANPGKQVAFPTLVPKEMRGAALRAEKVFKAALKRIEEEKLKKKKQNRKQNSPTVRPDGENHSSPNGAGVSKDGQCNKVGCSSSGGKNHNAESRKARLDQELRREGGSSRGGVDVSRWNSSAAIKYTPRGGLGVKSRNVRQFRIPQMPVGGRGFLEEGGAGGSLDGNVSEWRQKVKVRRGEQKGGGAGGQNAKDVGVDQLEAPQNHAEIGSISRGTNRLPTSFINGNERPKKAMASFPLENQVQGPAKNAERNLAADVPPRCEIPTPAPRFAAMGSESLMGFSSDQPQRRGSAPMTDLARLKERSHRHRKEAS